MKEFNLHIHLTEWFLRPQYNRHLRKIRFSFLCLTFNILKNKKK